MWHGYLLYYHCNDGDVRKDIGENLTQCIPNVYCNSDTIDSDHATVNFAQIDENIQRFEQQQAQLEAQRQAEQQAQLEAQRQAELQVNKKLKLLESPPNKRQLYRHNNKLKHKWYGSLLLEANIIAITVVDR